MDQLISTWRSHGAFSKNWSISRPALISEASCDYAYRRQSPLVKDFYSHFDPKYDVPRPSHSDQWLTLQRLSFFLARRTALDGYLKMFLRVNALEDQQDDGSEEEAVDWGAAFKECFVDPLNYYLFSGAMEWVAEGIRIAFGKYVYDHCNRRTAWKILKGPTQSSLRKITRRGIMSGVAVCRTEARGQVLPLSASTTLRIILHPFENRAFYSMTNITFGQKADTFLRNAICEIGCLVGKVVAAGVGGLIGVASGYQLYRWTGGDTSAGRWKQEEGGKDKHVPIIIFLPWSLANTVADFAVNSYVRPALEDILDIRGRIG